MFSLFSHTDDLQLNAFSLPPRIDSDGDSQDASITLNLYAPGGPGVTLSMSIDEAEEVAKVLVAVVRDAQNGEFSEQGWELVDFERKQDLERGWRAMMREGQRDEE